MIVSGKHKTVHVQDVDIEVSSRHMLDKIYHSVMGGEDVGGCYIGADRCWYVEDGFDYHKREDLYKKSRLATASELITLKSYEALIRALKDKNID